MSSQKKYQNFKSFYPYYLTEHADSKNRKLHFIGTTLLICFLVGGLITGKWWMFFLIPITGYGFAWVGHFFIEKNKPATFTYPLYSLAADFVMFWHTLDGTINSKLLSALNNKNNNN